MNMVVGESAFIGNMEDELLINESLDELAFLTKQYYHFRELQLTLTDILAIIIYLLERLANWEIGSLIPEIGI